MTSETSPREQLGSRPILCAVLDGAGLGDDPYTRARLLFEAGVDWIQLRDRALVDRALWQLTCTLVAARDEVNQARGSEPGATRRVLVNKRVDLTHAVGADGAHLGFDALSSGMSRQFLGRTAILGASLHSLEEVADAEAPVREAAGAEPSAGGRVAADVRLLDYAHLAPIWNPLSKPASRPALGLEALREACQIGLPLFAQGGVTPELASDAVRVGATGVAVTGVLQTGSSVLDVVRPLRESLDQARE